MSTHKNKVYSFCKQRAISFLDKNLFFKKVVLKIYHNLFPENKLSYWILKLDRENPIQVVQIGSNDGITGDPLYDIALERRNWNLLLVEPIPYLFKKLKDNYPEDPRFTFENVAINDGTVQNFYFINEGALPDEASKVWYRQIGSFQKEHVRKHFNIDVEKYIEEIEIKGVSLEQLLVKNNIKELDFLHIDAEGYDWKILSQLNLEKYKPYLILFEHKHLNASEINEAIAYLKDYKIFKFTGDYLCISKDKLTKRDFNRLKKRAVN